MKRIPISRPLICRLGTTVVGAKVLFTKWKLKDKRRYRIVLTNIIAFLNFILK